ncbi:GNAT family N-acetyltransferase [candidate division KSB1 bacterium]|nr:GNAT family N-acetyltransferase [candidate division KSB1 bacterium]
MQLILRGYVDVIANGSWELPSGCEILTLQDNQWPELAELYFLTYFPDLVANLEGAKEEMRLTQAGEFGLLIAELSPVMRLNNTLVSAIMTVADTRQSNSQAGLFIIEVMTHPAYRRRGIAENGLRWLASKAREQGFTTLALQVLAENLAAITLYRKLGFSDVQL